MLGQELRGSSTVGRVVVAIGQASQSKEPVGQRLVAGGGWLGSQAWAVTIWTYRRHPGPTGETVFASQDQLGSRQGEIFGLGRSGVPFRNPGESCLRAAASSALKLSGLRPKLVEVRVLG